MPQIPTTMAVCTHCNSRAFVNEDALRQHLKSSGVHPLCPPCNRHFVNEEMYEAHMAARHLSKGNDDNDLLEDLQEVPTHGGISGETARTYAGQGTSQTTSRESGFFAYTSQPQVAHCEMNEIHGDQIINYPNSGSTPTALAYVQWLIPQSALITAFHLNTVSHYLSNTNAISRTEPLNALTGFTRDYHHIRDLSFVVNVVAFCIWILRKFVARQ